MDIVQLDEDCIRIVGTDPSTQHMGVSFIDVNLKKPSKFKLVYVNTLHGDKLYHLAELNYDDEGSAQSRMQGVVKSYGELLKLYEPTVAICEDNFLGPSPDTFKRLVEVVSLIRMETQNHGNGLYLTFVPPKMAKEIVGANFRGTTKDDVLKGLTKYQRLDLNGISLDDLDEHSVDSIVVNLYLAERICKERGVLLDV